MKVIQGNLVSEKDRFVVVISRFNDLISSKLLEGAKDTLFRHGVKGNNLDIVWVPGAWEIPLIVNELALSGKYDAVIALGAVIRGDTPHFEYVSSEVSKGLANVGLQRRLPITFGVLTCDNLEQALLRSGSKAGNKGSEAALAALEMVNLLKEVRMEA